ncbi:hypothetical protein, partial [Corynebacterium flavescens]|uniref:hypothetical protein n=1 Tax=Corynebacterium flavescens TaxID=28028 RepID=UPI0023F0C2C8
PRALGNEVNTPAKLCEILLQAHARHAKTPPTAATIPNPHPVRKLWITHPHRTQLSTAGPPSQN